MIADDLIRPIAYGLWIQEGQPDGRAMDHWLEARRVALEIDLAQPWYNAAALVDETAWMRRALWQSQSMLN